MWRKRDARRDVGPLLSESERLERQLRAMAERLSIFAELARTETQGRPPNAQS